MLHLAVLTLLVSTSSANEQTHKYEEGESVKVWANKLGPFNNPLETYPYFRYPFCPPSSTQWNQKFPSLGEALQGDELVEHTSFAVSFRKNVSKRKLCSQHITPEQARWLHSAITEGYWYQYYVDDLPAWASIGKMVERPNSKVPHLFRHQHLWLGYNGNQIVLANLTVDGEGPIPMEGGSLEFTYSISWEPSAITYPKRWRRYLDNQFFEHKIHWFSIFNSFMMVLFLAGLVFTILSRTLKADYQRYSQLREMEVEEDGTFPDDSGWKMVHGDVFRVPTNPCLFCALIGTGYQLMVICFGMIALSGGSMLYASRGATLTYSIIMWAMTSFIAGFYSSALFVRYVAIRQSLEKQWIKTMVCTATVFPGCCYLSVFLMNFIAWGYHSSQAIPFVTMIFMVIIWLFFAFPGVVIGTLIARTRRPTKDIPRVSLVPRAIAAPKWYLRRWVFIVLGGILPFGSIFIEVYFVFTSFWNYKPYYVYGFMFLVFIILIVVTMCVSIVSTYFLLNAEDYRWPWTSFALSGSISVYMFVYSLYFFFYKTKMSGLLMITLYFGYMGLLSFGVGIMNGAIGFVAAYAFVKRIYRNVKMD